MKVARKNAATSQDKLDAIYLRTGVILLDYQPPIAGELKELWDRLGPDIMDSFTGAAGERPWGFWKHDAHTVRNFQAGKPQADGCFVDRSMLAFSDSGLISPDSAEFLSVAYERYAPTQMPAVEDDLSVLVRLKLATDKELEVFGNREDVQTLQPTPDLLPGKLVLQLRMRQIRDLADGDWPFRFDTAAASRPVEFAKLLRHSTGRWSSLPYVLAPWQEWDVIRILFGWLRRSDGLRRFDTSLVEVARKNGKSTLASFCGNYFLLGDREPRSCVFAAATKRDQANIVLGESTRQIASSAELKQFVKPTRNKLNVALTSSQFSSLCSDADSLDGLNLHAAIIDELHAHPSRSLYDVLETATGSREQPMLFSITTAGWNRNTICWEKHQYAKSVLQGSVIDPKFFAYIAALDEEDDWKDASVFYKANPCLGISLFEEPLLTQLARAVATPGFQSAFRQDRLNQWTSPSGRAIPMETWLNCGGDFTEESLLGKTCFLGVDISAVSDFTALALVFPSRNDTGKLVIKVLVRYWLPESTMRTRALKDKMDYPAWVESGLLRLTPGNAIDQDYVFAEIEKCAQDFDVREVAFDPWGARQLSERVGATLGKEVSVMVPPHFRHLSEPIKELFRMVLDRRIEHGNNPILTWNAGNLCVTHDVHLNYRMDKDKSTEKIDGLSATVVALSRALAVPLQSATAPLTYKEKGALGWDMLTTIPLSERAEAYWLWVEGEKIGPTPKKDGWDAVLDWYRKAKAKELEEQAQ